MRTRQQDAGGAGAPSSSVAGQHRRIGTVPFFAPDDALTERPAERPIARPREVRIGRAPPIGLLQRRGVVARPSASRAAVTVRGTLILVVGPSGVGKDSIIAGAAARLSRETAIVFARRLITRAAEAGGEDHIAVSPSRFAAIRDAGRLMLHWEAHGFCYGLSRNLETVLDSGRSVVANVSRGVVAEARRGFAPVAVVAVTASPATLAARLAQRGREDAAGRRRRLGRIAVLSPAEADFVIDNNGPLDAAIADFVAVLRRLVDQPANG